MMTSFAMVGVLLYLFVWKTYESVCAAGDFAAAAATKGLSDRPLETFGRNRVGLPLAPFGLLN